MSRSGNSVARTSRSSTQPCSNNACATANASWALRPGRWCRDGRSSSFAASLPRLATRSAVIGTRRTLTPGLRYSTARAPGNSSPKTSDSTAEVASARWPRNRRCSQRPRPAQRTVRSDLRHRRDAFTYKRFNSCFGPLSVPEGPHTTVNCHGPFARTALQGPHRYWAGPPLCGYSPQCSLLVVHPAAATPPSLSGRQVLAFDASSLRSAHATVHRAAGATYAAPRHPHRGAFVPGPGHRSQFRRHRRFDTSAAVHTCVWHRTPAPLTARRPPALYPGS